MKRDGARLSVCKAPNYGFQQYLDEMAPKLTSSGFVVDETAFLALIRKGFFGVGQPEWPETQRFVAELVKRGIPFTPTDPGNPIAAFVADAENPVETGD